MPGNLEQAYLNLFFQLQRQQWENYADAARHDLDQTNRAIYDFLNTAPQDNPFHGRKASVWQAISSKGRVENQPQVAMLRNRLDDWDNYTAGITTDDPQAKRLRLAHNMRADVLKLLDLRQGLAKEQGFASYVDLILASEDLTLSTVVLLLEQYLNESLATARALIQKHRLGWGTWFSDLDTLGGTSLPHDKTKLINTLLDKLGLSNCRQGLTVVTKPDGFGYTGVLRPANDVRVLTDSNTSLRGLLTLGHELGHAVAHLCNRNSGLFLTWTANFDESMAITLEHIAARLWLSSEQLKLAHDLQLLEGVRCSLSFLFELDLWQAPKQAEANYLKHYGRLGIDLGNPAMWALDSFRSIDPVYIHNYVLGDILAQHIIAYLEECYGADYHAWGAWLVKNYYAQGRERVNSFPSSFA